ncbi:Metallo-dependent phosphatase-like protein [Trichoderma velutinum]
MVAPGNNDADYNESNFQPGKTCPYGQYNFTDFINRWGRMLPTSFATESKECSAKFFSKREKTLANPPHWYSFDYGMVHMTMISTETDYPNAPDAPGGSDGLDAGPFGFTDQQLEFLKADLASVDRNITPWVIVSGHRPFYATGGHQCQQCQAAFEEIVYMYGVDLVVNGHQHNAERFSPVYNNTADPNGMNDPKAPMYIVNGGAGNIEGLADLGDSLPFSAYGNDKDFSFAKVKLLDKNHMQIDFIKSETREVLDSSVLFKSHKDQFVIN